MKTTRLHSAIERGFTLVELMITVAVIGIIAAVAVPVYNGYISDSHKAVIKNNIQSIRLFEKNYEEQHRVYISGSYDPANPGASGGLKQVIGWEPRTQTDTITYVATCQTASSTSGDPQCARGSGYYVNATDTDGTTVCLAFDGATCP